MTKIIDRDGKGSALSAAEYDANIDSACGINEAQTGTAYTVTIDDQNRTIELSNASPIAVTLTAISTIAGSLNTTDFKVTLKNIGAGLVTVTRGGTDTFDDGSTSITIAQYNSVTIQSDSTQAVWNILSEYREDAVSTGETQTLTDKTLTAPTIDDATYTDSTNSTSIDSIYDEDDMSSDDANGLATQQSIKAYVDDLVSTSIAAAVPVILDPPELVTASAVCTSTWTTVTYATLTSAQASAAIVRIHLRNLVAVGASYEYFAAYLRKTGSALAATDITIVGQTDIRVPSGAAQPSFAIEATVPLDASYRFDYHIVASDTTPNERDIVLVGYYQ